MYESQRRRSPAVRVLFVIALGGSGCFPGPIELEADTPDVVATDTTPEVAASDVEVDVAPGHCTIHDDCSDLDGPCSDGICDTSGTCRRIPRSGTCDDGDPCTKNDVCSGFECGGQAYVCDDSFACTTDTCDGSGGCLQQVKASACFIDGKCYTTGDHDPTNTCQRCDSGQHWTAITGDACDDGDACTEGDSCVSGACVPGGLPDDTPGDWLAELGTSTSSEFGASITDMRVVGAHVIVIGGFTGKVDFGPDVTLLDAGGAWFVASYSVSGEVEWIDVVHCDNLAMRGVTLDGRAVFAGTGAASSTWTDSTGDTALGLTDALNHFVALVDGDGLVSGSFATNINVRGVSPLDDLYGDASFTETFTPEGTTTGGPFDYHGPAADVALVELSLAGEPCCGVSFWGSSLSFDSLEVDRNGGLYAVLDAKADIHYLTSPSNEVVLSASEGQGALLDFDPEGVWVKRSKTLITYNPSFDHYSTGGYLSNRLNISSAASGGFWFWGSLTIEGADFADGTRFDAAHYNNLSGLGPVVGVGADAFVAHVQDDLRISWVRFIRPTGVDGLDFPTVNIGSVFDNSTYGIFSLTARGSTSIEDATGALHPLTGRTMLMAYAHDGTPLWSVGNSSRYSDVVFARDLGQGVAFAGTVFGAGNYGFGPTRRAIDEPGGVGNLQRIDSAGGLVCGAVLPPPED